MGEGPKRFFAPSRGVPEEYKASCRMIEPIHRSNEAPVRVPFPKASHLEFTSFVRDRDRRHFGESAMPSVTSRKDQELNWTTKKTVLCENNNQPCHGLKSEEYSLESIFDRKQRVSDTNLGKKRNYIPASSLGDKPYTGPERSPGFYKEGGLIAGSSIIQRTKTSCVPKAATSSNVSSRSLKSLTAHEKRELENINADITSIGTLTVSFMIAFCLVLRHLPHIHLSFFRAHITSEASSSPLGRRRQACGCVDRKMRRTRVYHAAILIKS